MAIFGKRTTSAGESEGNQAIVDETNASGFTNQRIARTNILKQFRLGADKALMARMDLLSASKMPADQLRREVETFVSQYSLEEKFDISASEQRLMARAMVDDMVGLGPLEALLNDESVTDIMVNNARKVYVERKGKLELTNVHFRDEAHVLQIAQRIASRIGRRVDESSPMVDARLADGSRVNVIMSPLTLDGTSISIRKFSKLAISLDTMAKQGNMSSQLCDFLKVAMACRLNVIVSGGTGSGKTTLLNALSQLISGGERIVTVEDSAELKLQQPHVVRLESRPPNIEGEGEITIRDLVKNALRMRPDRIVIGEVRGSESLDMLQAMNTGHDGSLSTVHANRAREALMRLENMVAMAGLGMPMKVIRTQIASAINVIVHISRMRDGVRRVNEVMEVVGMENDEVVVRPLFIFEYTHENTEGFLVGDFKYTGIKPSFYERAIYFNLQDELDRIIKQP